MPTSKFQKKKRKEKKKASSFRKHFGMTFFIKAALYLYRTREIGGFWEV